MTFELKKITELDAIPSVETTDVLALVDLTDSSTKKATIQNIIDSVESNATFLASNISNFDTEVTNNASVAANTAKRSYPLDDETKLSGVENGATADQTDAEIETAYNNQVTQVSSGEKTAGTETAVRRFSPVDVKDMVVEHAPVSVQYAMISLRSDSIPIVAAGSDYPFATEDYDTGSNLTLSGGQFSLTEGTYILGGSIVTWDDAAAHTHIYNISDSAVELYCGVGYSDTSDPSTSHMPVAGQIVVPSGGKVYSLRIDNGQNIATGTLFNVNSVIGYITFTKIA